MRSRQTAGVKVPLFSTGQPGVPPEPPPLPSEMDTLEQRGERTIQAEVETTRVTIPPTVSGSSSMRKVFSANELERMKELFVKMIQKSSSVSKVRIKETLEKIDWGVELPKKVSLDTVIDRIKYERRLRRASK